MFLSITDLPKFAAWLEKQPGSLADDYEDFAEFGKWLERMMEQHPATTTEQLALHLLSGFSLAFIETARTASEKGYDTPSILLGGAQIAGQACLFAAISVLSDEAKPREIAGMLARNFKQGTDDAARFISNNRRRAKSEDAQ